MYIKGITKEGKGLPGTIKDSVRVPEFNILTEKGIISGFINTCLYVE